MRKIRNLTFKCGYWGKMIEDKWAEKEMEGEKPEVPLKTQETRVDN